MVDDGLSKNPGQRKKRQERESCINNVKLNLNLTSTKDYSCRPSIHSVDNQTYTKRPRDKSLRGSLENVSSNPWGEFHLEEQSTLRRTRSLAITRENIFTSLDIPNQSNPPSKPRRAQLIPRAKLIERKEQRFSYKGSSIENIYSSERELVRQKPDYTPQNSPNNRSKRNSSSDTNFPPNINNNFTPKFIIGDEPDSLDIYQSKISHRVSYEDLPELSLPNYYPDFKYDTDNTTDNVSFTDNISTLTESCSNREKYSSFDTTSAGKWTINEQESISYDENIVLSTNRPLYDSISSRNHTKPRTTIRNHTPFREKNYSSDSSQDKTKESEKTSGDFQTNTSCDEIKLNNEKITKIVEKETETVSNYSKNNTISQYSNIETNPLYELITEEEHIKEHFKQKQTSSSEVATNNNINTTIIEVETNKETSQENYEEYKTIVHVDEQESKYDELTNTNKQHSHNYLKEFLETQKGSKKPLQNFITKKLSNLSRKNSKEIRSNLVSNQFYSLPDITIGRNLRRCEKIDRKLRKLERNNNESRFIVNIGKHFDVTPNNNIPVDFEVKIAKVPKKVKKNANHQREEKFLEAVKSLKDTLNNNCKDEIYIKKPEVIAVKPKDDIKIEKMETKEYQEKLGTMRNYWDRMIHGNKKTEQNYEQKNIDTQTKVQDVKKKFEPQERDEVEKPNKVQIAKQIFEPKINEKTDKISPIIKETCNYFENRDNQFESLTPNAVDIIETNNNLTKKSPLPLKKPEKKPHKPVYKSKSITYPEFDHVRYKVVKSDLFQKKIFANYEKESQFDGLMQYLQDYSFQELLIDNNIVIIEPIRTKIPHEASRVARNIRNITPLINKMNGSSKVDDCDDNGLKRHFFYHPIRVNKEVNDDELPNPDTVKQVRQFFECGLKRSRSSRNIKELSNIKCDNKITVDPDKDHCSATDSNSNPSNISDFGSQENLYDSLTSEHCCEQQFVSEDILKKIRDCGTTVTYYGGRVVKKQNGHPTLTRHIMEEIRKNEKTADCSCNNNNNKGDKSTKEIYQGVKFKLVKSNSCSSRLELVGTNDSKYNKQKFTKKDDNKLTKNRQNKDAINENIKQKLEESNQPRIIAEERKMIQWGELKKDKAITVNYNDKGKKINYDYHNYDQIGIKSKKIDDMEFEPYEVA